MCIISWKEDEISLKKAGFKRRNYSYCQGRLSIVGIGPGDEKEISLRAREAIEDCQVLVGYKTYVRLLKGLAKDKKVYSSGMTQEVKRARFAIKEAQEGKKVCLISSGDPGIYGMAGIVLEILTEEQAKRIKIEIIPGIMAATSCASLLGAPLMHDFAVISLSDILTDIGLIRKRIELSCKGDFAIVLYNPKSKKRIEPIKMAWEILMRYKSPDTPVGIVRNAHRKTEEVKITRLKDMLTSGKIDMVTTIIIGNSNTYIKNKYMITPRGYNII